MAKSILVIEGEHDDIIFLRRIINQMPRMVTRNMVWHEDRVLRHNGDVTFLGLSVLLDTVMQQARANAPRCIHGRSMKTDCVDCKVHQRICRHADCGYGECSGRWMGTMCETHHNGEGRCQR